MENKYANFLWLKGRAQLRRDPTAGAEAGGNPEAVPRGSGSKRSGAEWKPGRGKGWEPGKKKGKKERERERERKEPKRNAGAFVRSARGGGAAPARGVCASPPEEGELKGGGRWWLDLLRLEVPAAGRPLRCSRLGPAVLHDAHGTRHVEVVHRIRGFGDLFLFGKLSRIYFAQ